MKKAEIAVRQFMMGVVMVERNSGHGVRVGDNGYRGSSGSGRGNGDSGGVLVEMEIEKREVDF